MHRGREHQYERRSGDRSMNRERFGIAAKRRGWKINLGKYLYEENEQQHAQ